MAAELAGHVQDIMIQELRQDADFFQACVERNRFRVLHEGAVKRIRELEDANAELQAKVESMEAEKAEIFHKAMPMLKNLEQRLRQVAPAKSKPKPVSQNQ